MFLCLKHEITQMLAQGGGGAIVNTASIAGLIGLATSAHYVAAKHGVVGLTKSAAIEYAQDGIRVNCVNPGYVATPMTKETIEERGEEILAKVPMRRMGVPDEIAEAVVDVFGQGLVHDRRGACRRRRILRGLRLACSRSAIKQLLSCRAIRPARLGLARRPTWRTSKLSGRKRYSTSPTSLMPIRAASRRNDEAGGRRPDVAGVAEGEVAALMHVAARRPAADRRRRSISTSFARAGCGT